MSILYPCFAPKVSNLWVGSAHHDQVPKLLTVVECNELIRAAQSEECPSRSGIDDLCDGCIYRLPEHFHCGMLLGDSCEWINSFSDNVDPVPGLANTLWRRGLSVVFENIRFEEWEEVPAIALIGHAHVIRYPKVLHLFIKTYSCACRMKVSWIYLV